MPGQIPEKVLIYHFTHIDNLESILAEGVLHCKSRAPIQRDVGAPGIQAKRATHPVPDPPGGTIHDFVPFYFANRSPMLLRLASHYRTSYTGKQEEFVYIVGDVIQIANAGLPFVFTDGHSSVKITKFFTLLEHLDRVDWNVIASEEWGDVPGQDNDRKRRKQAEFMIKDRFPLTLSLGFAVMNSAMVERVKIILAKYPEFAGAYVLARPRWYYEKYA